MKKGKEEIIYGKLNDEDKDVEIKKVKVEMTTDKEEIFSLKSLCLILQVQPNPVSINDLHINCNNIFNDSNDDNHVRNNHYNNNDNNNNYNNINNYNCDNNTNSDNIIKI